MRKVAVLYTSHIVDEFCIEKFYKLRRELPSTYTLYWALDTEKCSCEGLPKDIDVFPFDKKALQSLNYEPIGEQLWGRVNYIIQLFYKTHPKYDYYWVVEYDVVFNGNWNVLFSEFEEMDASFISTHIEHYTEMNASWYWWNSLRWKSVNYELGKCVKAFNPIYRISSDALAYMDKFLKKGNTGHFEALMSTALYNAGYKLLDFGGTGPFVLPKHQNKFYIQSSGTNNGTMRWKPEYTMQHLNSVGENNKLYHPVKKMQQDKITN